MERLERLVVHVEEAMRFAVAPDEPRRRLGLMLLDSAAELMMHRQSSWLLEHAKMYRNFQRNYEEAQRRTGRSFEAELAEIRDRAVSVTRERQIERDYNAKCDYMVQHDLLAEPQARVLKKLHKYRNDTYHRDHLRPATLSSALRVYTHLVCSMLRDFSPFVTSLPDLVPAGLEKYLGPDERGMGLLGLQVHERIGARLLEESGVAEPGRIGAALAQHVEDRLLAMEDDAGECGGYLDSIRSQGGWDFDAVLCLVQLDPQEYGVHVDTPADARAQRVPIRVSQVEEWRCRSEMMANASDDLTAFATFADIEDAFEPIEQLVHQFAVDVDREIQLQIDIARGK